MPYEFEWNVRALFNRSTIYIAPLLRGGASWVLNTTHYDCCQYDRMQERNPFGRPARHYCISLLNFRIVLHCVYFYYVVYLVYLYIFLETSFHVAKVLNVCDCWANLFFVNYLINRINTMLFNIITTSLLSQGMKRLWRSLIIIIIIIIK